MEMKLEISGMVNLSEAAKLLKVSRPTIYSMIVKGELNPINIGRNRFVMKSEIEKLLLKPRT